MSNKQGDVRRGRGRRRPYSPTSVGLRTLGIGFRSVLDLLSSRWSSALADVGRRCVPLGLPWLLLGSSRKITRRAPGRGVRLWLRAPVVPLVPGRCSGVWGDRRPVSVPGVCPPPWSGRGWANDRRGLRCGL